jgi:hypothetical protein
MLGDAINLMCGMGTYAVLLITLAALYTLTAD